MDPDDLEALWESEGGAMATDGNCATDMRAKRRLEPDDTGLWLVKTAHSAQVWDMDTGRWMRVPGEGRSVFPGDNEWLTIYRIGNWPEVGLSVLVYLDDPVHHHMEQWRASTPVTSIEQVQQWPPA